MMTVREQYIIKQKTAKENICENTRCSKKEKTKIKYTQRRKEKQKIEQTHCEMYCKHEERRYQKKKQHETENEEHILFDRITVYTLTKRENKRKKENTSHCSSKRIFLFSI